MMWEKGPRDPTIQLIHTYYTLEYFTRLLLLRLDTEKRGRCWSSLRESLPSSSLSLFIPLFYSISYTL
jgi:hypothetical protein